MVYHTLNKPRAVHVASDAVPSSPSPFAEVEGPSKPTMSPNPTFQTPSTHANKKNNLSVHRGRPVIPTDFSKLPIIDVPLKAMNNVWTCCQCDNLGNALSRERCPICGHCKYMGMGNGTSISIGIGIGIEIGMNAETDMDRGATSYAFQLYGYVRGC
ncbi:hypothetical protein N7509_005671 [Penicillium cosmopolitanum]|uniref:RanBP2-type domain-containing protein n=1 Tax=Penicillium cosmopolitanum TaxID=1131564 RepID=A0A9W9W2Z9_9EURO|nr:uncharacterized protein N7509_005671 [Penicillium cosmopolitanum]KAJ5397558.1 hypothetical protein N7509_005671 [Penicillium cosmopolitanum]